MKLSYTTNNNRLTVELEGGTHREIWEQLASFQEVFEETTCGKCSSENLRFVMRTNEDNQFYELRCKEQSCRARLNFGCHKKGGGLFPKRKDADNQWKSNRGWVVFNRETGKEE